MKKLLYTIAVILVTSLVLTSCGEQQTEQVKCPVEVTYTVKCKYDLMDAINLVVTYKDKGGINASDTVRDSIWTKTVVSDVIPFKVGLTWNVSPKPIHQIPKDTLNLYALYSIECKEFTNRPVMPMFRPEKPMFNYRDFPVSKLATLCDYINLKQNNYLEESKYSTSLIIANPDSDHGLDIKWVRWDDK